MPNDFAIIRRLKSKECEVCVNEPDHKRVAPAAERNKQPILEALIPVLSSSESVLEIASGTGQHAHHICSKYQNLVYQPSDYNKEEFPSIEAYREDIPSSKILTPLQCDVLDQNDWPLEGFDLVININMIHIAPRKALKGLMAHSGRALKDGGWLYVYGPFWQDDAPRLKGNLDFDLRLKQLDPDYGIWHLNDVIEAARSENLAFQNSLAMPANNLSLFFRKET